MAGFTCRWEIQSLMVNHTGGLEVVRHVTGNTFRAKTRELAHRSAGVTGDAIERGMSPEERKTVLMIFDVLDGDAPSLHGVTFFAASPELAAMQVGVAVHAFRPHIRENGIRVAGLAIQLGVPSAKRKGSLVVVEIRKASDGRPAGFGVAILAGKLEVTVRTSRRTALRRLGVGSRRQGQNGQAEDDSRARSVSHGTFSFPAGIGNGDKRLSRLLIADEQNYWPDGQSRGSTTSWPPVQYETPKNGRVHSARRSGILLLFGTGLRRNIR